jgi:hypothetical protein
MMKDYNRMIQIYPWLVDDVSPAGDGYTRS